MTTAGSQDAGLTLPGEQLVNRQTAGDQTVRAIAPLAGGGYAVAWLSQDPAGAASPSISMQHYDATGGKAGAEALIPFDFSRASGTGGSADVSLAVLSDGAVVVAYAAERVVSSANPLARSSIFTQRFDAAGAAVGGETQVAAIERSLIGAVGYHSVAHPKVITWADGSWLVSWSKEDHFGVYGTFVTAATQRFDAHGAAVGAVHNFGVGEGEPGSSSSFAPMSDGGYLAGYTYLVQGQQLMWFVPVDSPAHTTSLPAVTGFGTGLPGGSRLLPLKENGYVLWSSKDDVPFTQMLDNAGAAVGPQRVPDHVPLLAQALGDGGFVVFWSVPGSDGDLMAQRHDSTGAPVGDEVRIDSNGAMPLITSLDDGSLALAWTGTGAAGDLDVYSQLLQPGQPPGGDAPAGVAGNTHAPSGDAAGGPMWQAAALYHAAFGALPGRAELSQWTAWADQSPTMGALGQHMIEHYAPGVSSSDLVSYLYVQLLHAAPSAQTVQGFVDQIGAGRTFATQGELFAYAASLPLNTDHMIGLNGSIQQLDPGWF